MADSDRARRIRAEMASDPAVQARIAELVAAAPSPPADAVELLRATGFPFQAGGEAA